MERESREKHPLHPYLPHVQPEIVAALPPLTDAAAQDRLIGDLGETQGDLYRYTLVTAQQLRERGADPADAYRLGMSHATNLYEAQLSLDSYRKSADDTADNVVALYPEQPYFELVPALQTEAKRPTWRERHQAHRQERRARRAARQMHVALGTFIVLRTFRDSGESNGDDAA